MIKKLAILFIVSSIMGGLTIPVFGASHPAVIETPRPKIDVKIKKVDLACMQRAVEKRDNALLTAFDVYQVKIKKALENRRDALKKALTITDQKERRKTIKEVWKEYKTVTHNAKKDWREARNNAWKQFYKDRRDCGPHALGEDGMNEAVDIEI